MTLPRLSPVVLRVLALAALGLYGAERWAGIVAPAARTPMVLAGALALAFGLFSRTIAPAPRVARWLLLLLGGLAVLLGLAWLFGVPRALLSVGRWPDLVKGLRQGLAGLPNASTPYTGVDPWTRQVILLGGGALLTAAAVLGLRRRAAPLQSGAEAAVPLVALVTVPEVVLPTHAEVAQGAALFAGLALLLWLDRLDRRVALPATGVLATAALVGALAAPALDRGRPWVNYEGLAGSLQSRHGERFDWNHRYGPLDWPRDGSEVLRVRTARPVFLKAENLDSFDGLRWSASTLRGPAPADLELPRGGATLPGSRQKLAVSVGNLQTREVIGAGATLAVRNSPSPLLRGSSPGTWITSQPLKPGDSYDVEVYAPHPSEGQLVRAGTAYPDFTGAYRQITLPRRSGGRALPGGAEVAFAQFHSRAEPVVQRSNGTEVSAAGALRSSPYAAAYALARRLAARAGNPYEFARSVQRYLIGHASYSEDTPRSEVPLATFLFRDHVGYCQQFSGAMALLLRMGGLPARVSAGFTPGAPGDHRGERVVYDVDAHSWVEAWFPRYGWVTFDPTPGLAVSVLGPRGVASAVHGGRARVPSPSERVSGNGGGLGASARRGHGAPIGTIGVVLLALLAIAAGAVALRTRRRRRAPRPADPWLAELERALRRAGRPADAATTLAALEQRLGASPEAAAYVRALAQARYGYGDRAPTAAERRALRAELARGLGASGHIRALWALPPRAPRRRAAPPA
jgi:transglutaminase-like putative cysteine protease